MPRARAKDDTEAPEVAPQQVLTWEEIRDSIGAGGIVTFQVSAEAYNRSTHAHRRAYHPRIVATKLRHCNNEEEISEVLSEEGYPDGSYLLTAKSGPGPKDWWKPSGHTITIPVVVGDGNPQPVGEEEDEEEVDQATTEDGMERSLLKQIRQTDLLRQLRVAEATYDEMQSRVDSRKQRDAMEIAREILDAQRDRNGGGGVGEVIAALVPLAVPLIDKFNSRDLGTKAAESVIGIVTQNAKVQGEISMGLMREMLQTQMDMMIQMQREKMGLDQEPQDPLKALLPQAIGTLIPTLAAAGQGGSVPPQTPSPAPTAAPTPPQPQQPAQLHPAQQFIRSLLQLAKQRPDAQVIYEKALRDAFGLLPEQVRAALLEQFKDESKPAFQGFAEWVKACDPGVLEAVQECLQNEQEARWVIEILAAIADDFIEKDEEESEDGRVEQPAQVG